MRISGLRGRMFKWGSFSAGAAMIVSGLFVTTSAVAASAAALTQITPTQGATLTGTALTDQLEVSGATGTVSYVQTTGNALDVSSTGVVTAPGNLSPGTYLASGNDSDTTGDNGTWTYTLTVLQPAPNNFPNTVVNVYSSMYSVAQQLGDSSQLQSVSQYQQGVSQLSTDQMASFYYATQQNPEWYQIPSLMQTVASDVGGANVAAGASSLTAVLKAGAKAVPVKKGSKKITNGGPSNPPVNFFVPQSCPAGIPDAALFALQIAVDVSQGVYNVLLATAVAFADAVDAQVGIGFAAVVSGSSLAHLSSCTTSSRSSSNWQTTATRTTSPVTSRTSTTPPCRHMPWSRRCPRRSRSCRRRPTPPRQRSPTSRRS